MHTNLVKAIEYSEEKINILQNKNKLESIKFKQIYINNDYTKKETNPRNY